MRRAATSLLALGQRGGFAAAAHAAAAAAAAADAAGAGAAALPAAAAARLALWGPQQQRPAPPPADPSQLQARRAFNFIPYVIESTSRGERAFDIYSRLLRERIVCVNGPIDDATSNVIIAQLLYLESQQPTKPVHMYINSPGGVVTAGLAIYDTMQYIKPAVSTLCVGQASSMASLLLAAGAPGERRCLPHARIMVHQPIGGAQGQASDILIQAAEIERLRDVLISLYERHTHKDKDTISRTLDRDFYMDAGQAKAWGVVDEVIAARSDATVMAQ